MIGKVGIVSEFEVAIVNGVTKLAGSYTHVKVHIIIEIRPPYSTFVFQSFHPSEIDLGSGGIF